MKHSICIATFNGEKYIHEQLNSILSQLTINDEIIISDDYSTDETLEILKSINDKRIKIVNNPLFKNKGLKPINKATKNFENSLLHATGDIIILCDQDDIWAPTKLRKLNDFFNSSDVMLIVHDAKIVNEHGQCTSDSYFKMVDSGPGVLKNIYKNTYLGCCISFRREILEYVLPFPKNLHAHDMWIGILAESLFSVKFSSEKLISYRRHSKTVTPSGAKSKNRLFYQLKYRLIFTYYLIIRKFKINYL